MAKPTRHLPVNVLALSAAILIAGCDRKHSTASTSPANGGENPSLPELVTFNAHIRPILSDKCFSCHGFDAKTREAKLRLDTPEGAYATLEDDKDKHAIVPGKSSESEVWRRITSKDPDLVMPVPDFHKPLSQREIGLIGKWIDQGAKYEQHWSFAPIVKAAAPSVKHAELVANPIDAFVLARLEAEKIEPSPLADKATLLRRLSLDLTGLPPKPEELDAFLKDESPDAYGKQVDRLLASPHYGERMAVPWLDVVRFADTVGYHGDQNIRVFPYRDYVIQSFNDNKPFDRFTIEQLAGDLLPDVTDEQRIATGFLRLNLVTREGGAQDKEYMAKSMGDRVRAVGAAWLGLTTGCAECHDHKFDPITAKDFYSLGAFFSDVRQWGVYADYGYTPNPDLKGVNNDWPFPPEIRAPNAAARQRLEALRSQAVNMLGGTEIKDPAAFEQWVTQAKTFVEANPTGWQALASAEVSVKAATPFGILSDQSVRFTGPPKDGESAVIRYSLPPGAVAAIRLEALPDPANGGHVGRQADGRFSVTPTFVVDAGELKISYAQADQRAPHKYDNGEEDPKLEPEWRSAPGIWEDPRDAASKPQTALYHLAEPLADGAGKVLTVTLASKDIGRVRISVSPLGDPIAGQSNAMFGELRGALSRAKDQRTSEDRVELVAAFTRAGMRDQDIPKDYKKLREAILACRGGYAYSVVAQTLPPEKIPAVHLLPRGDWMNPGPEVKPAVPDFLPHASVRTDADRLNRLDLAKWLVSAENPLTARQFSNRLWKQFFGRGLSSVLDDIGNQGEWPSNPELLDWLSAEFRDSGWDVKHVVRLIVTSHTYRRQSASRADLSERDPANRLLAGQSPRRLDAEFVRDNILAISGTLVDGMIGGPSVKPYQPAGYYANLNFPARDYPADMDEGQYRRGLYMHWQRTFMHPMLAGFDAPSREECSADRLQSNSPQQALILLNDPSFVEAAREFAVTLLEKEMSDEDRLKLAIRRALGREMKKEEGESLTKFLQAQRANLKTKADDPAAFLKVGNSKKGAQLDPLELTAWAQTCRVILNLHETLTRY